MNKPTFLGLHFLLSRVNVKFYSERYKLKPYMIKSKNEETIDSQAVNNCKLLLIHVFDCNENDDDLCIIDSKGLTTKFIIEKQYTEIMKIPLNVNEVSLTLFIDKIEITKELLLDKSSNVLDLNISNVRLLLFYCKPLKNDFVDCFPSTKVIGHRGDGEMNIYETRNLIKQKVENVYYENTVNSFNKAFRKGAEWIELDVQLTKDKIPIVFHDLFLNFDNNKAHIHQINNQEFKDYFGYTQPENDLPSTLENVSLRKEEKLGMNLEIKYPDQEYIKIHNLNDIVPVNEYVDKIVEVLSEIYDGKVMFSSFDDRVVLYLRIKLPNSKILFIVENNPEDCKQLENAISFCSKASLDGLVMDCELAEEFIISPHSFSLKSDLKFFVYGGGVSNELKVRQLLMNGIDGVITDNIEKIINLK